MDSRLDELGSTLAVMIARPTFLDSHSIGQRSSYGNRSGKKELDCYATWLSHSHYLIHCCTYCTCMHVMTCSLYLTEQAELVQLLWPLPDQYFLLTCHCNDKLLSSWHFQWSSCIIHADGNIGVASLHAKLHRNGIFEIISSEPSWSSRWMKTAPMNIYVSKMWGWTGK